MAEPDIRVACRLVNGGWDCHVNLRDEAGPAGASDYNVTVSVAELARFGGETTPEKLITASFRFLLEREPSQAILRRFALSEIEGYFPEYAAEIDRLLKAA